MTVLQLTNVSKRYDSQRWALHHLTLRQEEGVLGVVGPNGAGKTTLLRLLATLLVPTEGTLVWNQWDIAQQALAVRRELGFLPQEFGVYPHLTAEEFLRYLGTLKGLSPKRLPQRVDAVL